MGVANLPRLRRFRENQHRFDLRCSEVAIPISIGTVVGAIGATVFTDNTIPDIPT